MWIYRSGHGKLNMFLQISEMCGWGLDYIIVRRMASLWVYGFVWQPRLVCLIIMIWVPLWFINDWSLFLALWIRPLLVVNVFLVTSELTKTCGRAVIIIHYSIFLPQHYLYNLLNILNRMLTLIFWACAIPKIMTIMAKTGGLLNRMRAGDQKHIFN